MTCVTFEPMQLRASVPFPSLFLPCSDRGTLETTVSSQCSFRMEERCPAYTRFNLDEKQPFSG